MTRWLLKTTGRGISVSGVLAVVLPVLMGAASGCGMGAEKQYTILLHTFSGPNHVRQSKLYRDKTRELAGWGGLDIVHKNNNSELYWGKYPSIPSANADLKTARTWHVPNVKRAAFPFPKVMLIPGKEIEIPEYNVSNAPGGIWTILVAIYVDDPANGFIGRGRQKHALTYCSWLRKQGYEAYYRHLPGRSQITVGVFPENAVVAEIQNSPKRDMFITKQVIRSAAMRKIMATRDPPLYFLLVNDHIKQRLHIDKRTGKTIATTRTRTHPILIPGRKFSKIHSSERGLIDAPSGNSSRDR